MIECHRCDIVLDYLKKTLDKRTPTGYERSFNRIKGNLEEIYKQSNCAEHEVICNPLKKIEEEKPH